MYGKPGCVSLNELICEKAYQKKIMANNLPPCDGSFIHHLGRRTLQLIVWREAIVPIQEKLDPVEYGYEKGQYGISIMPQMTSQTPTPPKLLNDLACICSQTNSPCGSECICSSIEQPCTAACTCGGLINLDDSGECVQIHSLKFFMTVKRIAMIHIQVQICGNN